MSGAQRRHDRIGPWRHADLDGAEGVAELPAIGCRLAFTNLYDGMKAEGA